MPSVDLSVVTKRKNDIKFKVRRSSPALVYSSNAGIHVIAPHLETLQHRHRVFRILDRLAFVPRGTAIGCKKVAEHGIVEGERKGLELSRGYVFAEQITASIAEVLSQTYHSYWAIELPVEGLLAKLGEEPDSDELFFIDVTGEYWPFKRVFFLGSVDRDGKDTKAESDNTEKLQEALQANWEPGAGFDRILEIYHGLEIVQAHPDLKNAFQAPRVEQVLLDRSQITAKNWRAIFQRQS